LAVADAASAQTAYLNTEAGRPLRTEDAYVIDRYRLDAHLGPATWEHSTSASGWLITPEIEYGILPRTQVQLAVPFGGRSVDGRSSSGISRVDASALYALNNETRSWPALAVRAGASIPVGEFGIQQGHTSVAALATRTFSWGRLSANHEYTFGDEPDWSFTASPRFSTLGYARWRTSASVDRALPLRGLLLGVEAVAQQALQAGERTRWNLGAGFRYQLSGQTLLDAGISSAVTGSNRPTGVTVGITHSAAVPSLIPGIGRWGR
jgi:hypothetical protein